ncbi:MAG TPA: UDP-N-acetylmuramate dehydrogenase [Gammaproteobacteria bacterium]|nr:UDP-N-acetylmuramate dehydrogenase [Gammaproteobacteria bacterium]
MTTREQPELRGELRVDEPMARHTSWRTGGPVDRFYRPADAEDLCLFLSQLDSADEIFMLGLGSNLLVRDGGLRAVVIATSGCLNGFERLAGNRVRVEAGVACPQLARQCARQGLRGVEFLCGVPGTVGGALALNAGAAGSETWDLVESVLVVDRSGRLHERSPEDFRIAYRHVENRVSRQEWFVAATLRLSEGDAAESQELIRTLLARRGATQPTSQPNAGSVFRNPPGDYAARLIESCGLKGYCIGGACVSEKHANFIINTGTALAADIEHLIEHVERTVKEVTGVTLVREVHIVGEALRR